MFNKTTSCNKLHFKKIIHKHTDGEGRLGAKSYHGLSPIRGCKSLSETIVTRSKAVTGNNLGRSDCVDPSQSPIELTLDNEI